MRSRAIGLALLMLVSIGWVMLAPDAYAADTAASKTADCSTYVGLTNRIAGCIRDSIDAGAAVFFDRFYPIVQTAIGATTTIAVLIYGVMMAMGMVEKIGRDSMLLLFKIAGVVYFSTASPWVYSSVTTLMDEASAAVVNYVPPSGPTDNAGTNFSQSVCLQNMRLMQEKANQGIDPKMQKKVVGPWLGMDCLLDSVIGIKVIPPAGATTVGANQFVWYRDALDSGDPSKASNNGMSRGLFFFFFSGMQTSIIGFVLAAIGFIFIYGLIWLVIKAFFTYIAGYMGVAFMVIISPLFIPMVLFTNTTRLYFDKWVKVLISFALQPVIILVFITFSLSAMDLAAFSGKYSIMYRIAGDESQKKNFDLNKYLTDIRTKTGAIDNSATPDKDSRPIILAKPRDVLQVKSDNATKATSYKDKTDVGGKYSGLVYSMCTKQAIAADTSKNLEKACAYQYPIRVTMESIDWDRMAAARKPTVTLANGSTTPGQQIFREVIAAVAFCGIVVFIMNGLMAVVPMLANDMLGDAVQSANLGSAMMSKTGAGPNPITGSLSSKLEDMVGRR